MIGNNSTRDSTGGSPLPRVSIIVPTHQRPEMLSRLLESFRQLTYPESRLELVVVGGARDPGRLVVESFARTVAFPVSYSVVPDEAVRSASLKRNEGARSARGDILAFTDDDCVAHPKWIDAAAPFFETSEVGGVEGAVEIPKPDRLTMTYRGSMRLSLPGGYQTCNVLYRKSVFEQCRGFDVSFPYYLEDTDLACTVMERGYTIPFAANAVVSHPVQAGHPIKLLTMARTVERIPYLFRKHPESKPKLRTSIRLLNRSHYAYLALYAGGLLLAIVNPFAGAIVVGLGLCILMPVHLTHDFWGLHFTASELALTALCLPIVPVLRLSYWLKGLVEVHLSPRRQDRWRGMSGSTRI